MAVTVKKEMPLSSGNGRQRLAPTFADKLERPDRVETKIWELDLSQYLAGDEDEEWNVNGQYVQANYSYRHAEYPDLLLSVPSETDDISAKLQELEEWGCTPDFLALFQEAHAAEVRFLLFWC